MNSRASCGVRAAGTHQRKTSAAVADLKQQLGDQRFQYLLVLFAIDHDAAELARELEHHFPGQPYSGCTTAGEIGPHGMSDGGIVMIAFPTDGFRICAAPIENMAHFGVERASQTIANLRSKIFAPGEPCVSSDLATEAGPSPTASAQTQSAGATATATATATAGQAAGNRNAEQHPTSRQKGLGGPVRNLFALLLVDGLSNTEEMLVAAVNWALGDLPLVGGSSGDSLAFRETTLIHNGQLLTNAAILILVDTDYPFEAFRTQEFDPTDIKLVVTAADTERRIVHELNAEPAATEYARSIGLLSTDLNPFSFASHPLVVRIGDEQYCRSIRKINEDGSLSFFCAIDEGLVFTVATPKDMVRSTQTTLEGLSDELGGLDIVIGFDCILRRLDAERRQVQHQLNAAYRQHNVVGFHTYGEQFNAMHLNQTLTGIAFGPKALRNGERSHPDRVHIRKAPATTGEPTP